MNVVIRLIAGVLLAGVAMGASANVIINLVPDAQNVQVGSQVSLDLNIEGLGDHVAPSLGGFSLNVTFDAARFSFDSATFGSALGDLNSFEAFSYADGTTTPGTITLSETSFLDPATLNSA